MARYDSSAMQEEPVSKTKRKAEMLELQALGATLLELPPARLVALGLPDALAAGLREAQRISSREGRKDLIEILGEDGYKVVQKMYLAKGASARSVKELKQMKAEVYEGLSVREKKILDVIILDDRMIDIAKYRGEGEFNYPKGLTPKDFIAHRTLFGEIEGLSKEQVAKLNQRASAYFEWMKKPLKDMLESGLISKEEFDKLASHNYRRIKLVDIFDKRYSTKVGDKKRTVYDSGVEALARGRETDIYEPSSEIMALEVFNRAYGRILNNEANKMLLELAEKDNENPFVRIKSKDRNEKIPSGWNRIFVFDKGERKSLWISPEMGKEWIIRSREISYKMGQVLRYASGSPILRTFATGINWGFALANIPRDVMHRTIEETGLGTLVKARAGNGKVRIKCDRSNFGNF